MEEVHEVGPQNMRKSFWVEELFHHEMFLVISRSRKSLVMSTPKPDNFMQLFLTFVWCDCINKMFSL